MSEPNNHVPPQKSTIAVLRGSPEFHSWFNRLRDYTRLPGAFLLDAALVAYAKAKGFQEPPPR